MLGAAPSAWEFHAATSYDNLIDVPTHAHEAPAGDVVLPAGSDVHALHSLLHARISCRTFGPEPLMATDLAAILDTAYGELGRAETNGHEFVHRPVPSAGARYPLHLFVLARDIDGVEPGVYRYEITSRALVPLGPRPADSVLAEIFLDQPYVAGVPAIVMLAGHLALTLERYASRGYRYVLFEAGHVAQNIVLAATALGLGSLTIGGFYDAALARVLSIDGTTFPPLYGVALGPLGSEDPSISRSIPN